MSHHRCFSTGALMAKCIVACLFFAISASAFAKATRIRLVWQDDPTSTMTVVWHQESGKPKQVLYSTKGPISLSNAKRASKTSQISTVDYMEMQNASAHLKKLKADTLYHFAINDSEGLGKSFSFKTASDTRKPFTFIAGGDSKTEERLRERYRKGNRMVAKLHPLFVLYAGDFTSGDGLNAEGWQHWLKDWSELSTTTDGRMIPIVPVRGNHEADEDILYRLFGLRSPKNYFALSFGGDLLRLYALNSEINIVRPSDKKNRSGKEMSPIETRQREWFIKDLESTKATFTAASYHKPIRPHTKSKGENDYLYRSWADVFHIHQLDLSIDGDSHMHKITWPVIPSTKEGSHQGFIRNDKEGTVFTGEGSWGAPERANNDDKPWTRQSGSIHQFKWIHVHPDQIKLHTVLLSNEAKAKSNSDADPFHIPEGIELFDPTGNEPFISVPARSK